MKPTSLLAALVLASSFFVSFNASSQVPPLRVLPLGDSITFGSGAAGGYRDPLYALLTNAGYNVDFVGTQTGNGVATLPDSDHEGHGGWRIDQIDSIILSVFAATADPDIILLLLGTNDYGQNYDTANATNRLEALIARMALALPYAKIVVANLTPRGEPQNTAIQNTFNPFVPLIVERQRALGRDVYFTDLYNAVPLADMPDNLHPNLLGYTKMATNWFGMITNLFSPFGSTNAPAISRAVAQNNLSNIVITFSKPVADDAANVGNFALSGGATVLGASLDPVSRRDVTLRTTPLTAGTSYTLTVNGVNDRTPAQTPLAADATTEVYAYGTIGRGVFTNVPEAGDYALAYSLNIPNTPNYLGGVVYDLDLSRYVPPFSRVAYYLELQPTNGPVDFIWVSMDAFTNNAAAIGVPTVGSGAFFQRAVANMNVLSSVLAVTPGTNLTGGNMEFWPGNFQQTNSALVPNASSVSYDFGDNVTAGNYGSMQLHNHDASQVLFAFNRWGGTGGTADIGIGNRPGSTDLDWTFAQNASSYVVKQLQIFVLPVENTNPPVLVNALRQVDLTSVVLNFSKALDDSATNLSHYALDGGLTVQAATLDPLNRLSVTLTTSPQTPGTTYTVTVNDVQDRTPAHLVIAPDSKASFISLFLTGGGIYANVPGASNYTVAYSIDLPIAAGYNSTGATYQVDNHFAVTNFSRVAYYLELALPGGPTNFIWLDMDPFTQDAGLIGIPARATGAFFQQPVSNLTVYSSMGGIANGTQLTGNLEFWPWDYYESNIVNVANAGNTVFDWGDAVRLGTGGYGSMQIHNPAASQTLMAINNFGGTGGGNLCLGIGNNTSTTASDWTHVKNAATYSVRRLQVLVLPDRDTVAPVLVSAVMALDGNHIVVTFSEPLADGAADLANFALDGGATLIAAALNANLREVVLTTSLLNPAGAYSITVSNVRDRSANPIAAGSTIAVTASTAMQPPASLLGNVPDAANFKLVYYLDIPVAGPGWNLNGTVYNTDNRIYVSPFSKVAYYLELATNGGATNWIFVSMDAFTSDPNKIGVPDMVSGAFFQQPVTNMTVYSSDPSIVTGWDMTTGNIEFWPFDYSAANSAGIPSASATIYDWGDQASKTTFGTSGYGSMQVHNNGASQVLFAYNRWGRAETSAIGIGNSALRADARDWTFADNAGTYVHKKLYVLVQPAVDVEGPILVRAVPSSFRTNLVVTFNEPVDDTATNPANYSLGGDVVVTAASLRPNRRDVVLTTTAQAPGVTYQLYVNDVFDSAGNLIFWDTSASFTAPPELPLYSLAPESTNFLLVHHLALPGAVPNYNLNGITYNADLRASILQPFNRVAYYLELATAEGGATNWIYVSTDAFTTNINRVGVPVVGTGAGFQQRLTKMNVFSSDPAIVTGVGITSGNIEFWGCNYNGNTNTVVPTGATGSVFDWNDTTSGGGYGSMQIHNWGANSTGQVLFAFNKWGGGQTGNACVGIGTRPASANMDWTFGDNAATYAIKNLYVLVQPTNIPPAVILPAPPVIVTHPASQEIAEGAPFTLTVNAIGTSPLDYQWQRNETPLAGETNFWLTRAAMQSVDAGNYTVVVTNIAGAATSFVARVTIPGANLDPAANDDGAATVMNQPLTLTAAFLLQNDTDPDGDPLTVVSVTALSTNLGNVSLVGNQVTYTPPSGYVGLDRFSYTVSDGRGGSASANVSINVVAGEIPSYRHLAIAPSGGGYQFRFSGVPGSQVVVQRSTNLVNWTTLTNVTVPIYGVFDFTDAAPPAGQGFYRINVP